MRTRVGATLNSERIVKSPSDFGTIRSDILYLVDGNIDMGNTSIEVPSGGINIQGLGYNLSSLYSTEDNHKLFITKGGEYAGDVIIKEVSLYVTGSSSQVFDLDNQENNGTIELVTVNIGTFDAETTNGGEITSYRQFRTNDFAFIRAKEGITFSGTMAGGMSVRESILLSIPANTTIFKEGTNLSIEGSVVSNINALLVDPTVIVWDFDTSVIVQDDGFLLTGARFASNDPLPNIDEADPKVRFSSCVGVKNTYVGGAYTVTGAADTIIPGSGQFVKMAGTTTYGALEWFSSNGNNSFTYDSTQPIAIKILASLSFSGANNRQVSVQVRKWDDSASQYVDIEPPFVATLNGGILNTRAENISIVTFTEVDKDDRIEVWIANLTDSTNIETLEGGIVFIEERAS